MEATERGVVSPTPVCVETRYAPGQETRVQGVTVREWKGLRLKSPDQSSGFAVSVSPVHTREGDSGTDGEVPYSGDTYGSRGHLRFQGTPSR